MTKREKLQLLLTGKTPKILEGFKAFDTAVAELKKNLEETIRVSTLDEVGSKLNELRKKVDFTVIENAITSLKQEIEDNDAQEKKDLETKLNSLRDQLASGITTNGNEIKDLDDEIDSIQTQIAELLSRKPIEIPDFTPQITKTESVLRTLISKGEEQGAKSGKEVQKQFTNLESKLKEIRAELVDRINSKGGGNMNRQIFIGGVDFLKKYTDYNIKAGTNVTITYQDNNTTKKVDVTISATGGGGGSVRSINSVAINTNAGSTAGTDYVYLCAGTITITMPTTVSNTNLYTIKNIGAGTVTINTTGGETIDGQLTQVMPVQFTSVDLISNNSGDWAIT